MAARCRNIEDSSAPLRHAVVNRLEHNFGLGPDRNEFIDWCEASDLDLNISKANERNFL